VSARRSDTELLELLCAGEARGRPDAGAAEELAEFERLLARARAAALAPVLGAERERALVERILVATTREDGSRRADLRLAAAFLRARLRESRALRLAAASLLAHATLASAAAWSLLR
jgi:hypothetical protein